MKRQTTRSLEVLQMFSGLLCALCVLPGHAQTTPSNSHLDVQLAFEHSRGIYGETQTTTIQTTTATMRWQQGRWRLQAELPWLDVRSSGASGGLPNQTSRGGSHEKGQGDAWLKLSWQAREWNSEQTGLDLTVKTKTKSGAADKGLGSGAVDWALQLEWASSLGPWVSFGEVGHRRTGDVAGAVPYNDPWYGQWGLQRSWQEPGGMRWESGAYLDLRERIGRLGSLREFTVFVAPRSGQNRWQWYLTWGTTPASPRYAMGLSWRHRFDESASN